MRYRNPDRDNVVDLTARLKKRAREKASTLGGFAAMFRDAVEERVDQILDELAETAIEDPEILSPAALKRMDASVLFDLVFQVYMAAAVAPDEESSMAGRTTLRIGQNSVSFSVTQQKNNDNWPRISLSFADPFGVPPTFPLTWTGPEIKWEKLTPQDRKKQPGPHLLAYLPASQRERAKAWMAEDGFFKTQYQVLPPEQAGRRAGITFLFVFIGMPDIPGPFTE